MRCPDLGYLRISLLVRLRFLPQIRSAVLSVTSLYSDSKKEKTFIHISLTSRDAVMTSRDVTTTSRDVITTSPQSRSAEL